PPPVLTVQLRSAAPGARRRDPARRAGSDEHPRLARVRRRRPPAATAAFPPANPGVRSRGHAAAPLLCLRVFHDPVGRPAVLHPHELRAAGVSPGARLPGGGARPHLPRPPLPPPPPPPHRSA